MTDATPPTDPTTGNLRAEPASTGPADAELAAPRGVDAVGPAHSSPARTDADSDPQERARLAQELIAEEASAADQATAHDELQHLADHWDERAEAFDPTAAGDALVEQRSLLGDAAQRFAGNRGAVFSLLLIILMAGFAIFAPVSITTRAEIAKYNEEKATGGPTTAGKVKLNKSQHDLPLGNRILDTSDYDSTFDFKEANQGVSLEHPFGTDNKGRDMWVRVWLGARISLAIGFAVALTILIIGIAYGSIAGFLGGKIDTGMMRLLDALYGLPYIPFAIITITIVKTRWPGANPLFYMVPALSLTTWFTAARIMRSQVLSLKTNEYVEAAAASGARWYRIVGRHIVPNTIGIMVVAIFLEVPNAILGEATLSYLGLGVDLPAVSWGKLANEGFRDFRSNPHLIWIPGGLIAITVLAAISVADGLRDALDPRGKR